MGRHRKVEVNPKQLFERKILELLLSGHIEYVTSPGGYRYVKFGLPQEEQQSGSCRAVNQ